LRLRRGAFSGDTIFVAGRSTAGDGGEGNFVWRTGSTTDNGGTLLAGPVGSGGYWERADVTADVDPRWFGAVLNGSTNTLTQLQAAAAAAALRPNKTVRISGPMAITTASGVIASGVTLRFEDGGYFTGAGLSTLTINAKIPRHRHQVFYGYPTVTNAIDPIPIMWGADPSGSADSIGALQATIDAILYNAAEAGRRARIRFPSGTYRTTKTLHLGYGAGIQPYKAVTLRGDGPSYRNEALNPGTVINADFTNGPAIAVQGGRLVLLEDIGIIGKNLSYARNNNLASFGPLVDDTDPDNWIDPSLLSANPNIDGRYTPYAGVAIDPYSGTQPSPHYPDVDYPSFLGAVSQYGKNESSGVTLRRVYIGGFAVGVTNQPSDFDQNGDFLSLDDCYFEFNKWCLSICNTQSRNVSVSKTKFSFAYCLLTNRQHGRKQGKVGGTFTDLSAFSIIKMLDLGQYAGPLVFNSPYVENLWQMGDWSVSTQAEGAITVNGGEFAFDLQDDDRGVPAVAGLAGYQQESGLTFNGTQFRSYPSVVSFDHLPTFNNCQFRKDSRTSTYEKYAHNVLCGGLATKNLGWKAGNLRHQVFNLDTGSLNSTMRSTDPSNLTNRSFCLPRYARSVTAQSELWPDEMLSPVQARSVSKSALARLTLTDKELELTFSSRPDWEYYQYGLMPGDVITDDLTGSVFFVRTAAPTFSSVAWSRSGATVTVTQSSHGRVTGDKIYVTASSDAAAIPLTTVYTITVSNANTWTFTGVNTGAASGTFDFTYPYLVKAVLQNNYRSDGMGGYDTIDEFSTTVGTLYYVNSRVYTPSMYLRGTTTAGSGTIQEVARDDTSATFASEISTGDWMLVQDTRDRWVSPTAARITAVSNTGGVPSDGYITIGSIGMRSQTRRRLDFFVRQPPANA
jgi:hypothetical protein